MITFEQASRLEPGTELVVNSLEHSSPNGTMQAAFKENIGIIVVKFDPIDDEDTHCIRSKLIRFPEEGIANQVYDEFYYDCRDVSFKSEGDQFIEKLFTGGSL